MYQKLVKLLDEQLSENGWKNLSIPVSRALEVFSEGELAFEQEFELQERRLILLGRTRTARAFYGFQSDYMGSRWAADRRED